MTEAERLKCVKSALQSACVKMVDAETDLKVAAMLAATGSDKKQKIQDLKSRLDRLGVEILELSKVSDG